MALSGRYMCNICGNHESRSVFLNLLSSNVALYGPSKFSTCSNYYNLVKIYDMSRLKMWHFLDIVCSVSIVTIAIELSYCNRSRLKKWHFLGLICAIYVATMRTEVYLSNLLSSKSGSIWTYYVEYM